MNQSEREEREYKSLFEDERYAKKAWRKFIATSLESDAAILNDFYDHNGNITPQSEIYRKAYWAVEQRLRDQNIQRKPMKAEVLIEAAVIRASFDNSALNTIFDRTAGKVKEELTIGVGQYESLTDEELQLLAAHRATQIEAPKDEEK